MLFQSSNNRLNFLPHVKKKLPTWHVEENPIYVRRILYFLCTPAWYFQVISNRQNSNFRPSTFFLLNRFLICFAASLCFFLFLQFGLGLGVRKEGLPSQMVLERKGEEKETKENSETNTAPYQHYRVFAWKKKIKNNVTVCNYRLELQRFYHICADARESICYHDNLQIFADTL